jgi:Tol biopolymer transport system component
VALTSGQGTDRQVWVKQLDRGPASRVAESGFAPSWVPGGERLVFASPSGIHTVPASGVARPSPIGIGTGGTPVYSPDGKWLVLQRQGDLVLAGTEGDTVPRAIVADPTIQLLPTISPDGRWLAYASDETGSYQVYVRSFPDVSRTKRQVSVSSGWAPRWSRDGRELFFVSTDARIWSARVNGSGAFTSEEPQPLFSAEQFGPIAANYFDVHPDGRRFLFTRAVGRLSDRPDEMIVVQNFVEELKAKVKP